MSFLVVPKGFGVVLLAAVPEHFEINMFVIMVNHFEMSHLVTDSAQPLRMNLIPHRRRCRMLCDGYHVPLIVVGAHGQERRNFAWQESRGQRISRESLLFQPAERPVPEPLFAAFSQRAFRRSGRHHSHSIAIMTDGSGNEARRDSGSGGARCRFRFSAR